MHTCRTGKRARHSAGHHCGGSHRAGAVAHARAASQAHTHATSPFQSPWHHVPRALPSGLPAHERMLVFVLAFACASVWLSMHVHVHSIYLTDVYICSHVCSPQPACGKADMKKTNHGITITECPNVPMFDLRTDSNVNMSTTGFCNQMHILTATSTATPRHARWSHMHMHMNPHLYVLATCICDAILCHCPHACFRMLHG